VRRPVGFAMNASSGAGGQGQFLLAMVRALEAWGPARAYARSATSSSVECVSLPFTRGWRRRAFDAILAVPGLRRRSDWLALLSDEDFDRQVAASMEELALFDGTMGQCRSSFRTLERTTTKRVLTSVITHPQHLERVVDEERRRLGVHFPSFVHPSMVTQAREELAMADAVRVNSSGARQTFLDYGVDPDRVRSINVGINLDHFRPVQKPDDVFRVTVCGWIAPHKGTLYALQAFERARLPNAELVFIGGTGDSWSRRLMSDYMARLGNVRMTPMDPSTEPVERHYGRASVMLHASLIDGFGLVIPEALACGCPVIVTRESGASELVRDGENGFVVDARDVDTMAERLRLLHADPVQSVRHLTYEGFASNVRAFYDHVLG
jgi:glycosyltransferase involved in cell wall biosynthesis